jgi:type I restriction-modification system DNA methylase subunit
MNQNKINQAIKLIDAAYDLLEDYTYDNQYGDPRTMLGGEIKELEENLHLDDTIKFFLIFSIYGLKRFSDLYKNSENWISNQIIIPGVSQIENRKFINQALKSLRNKEKLDLKLYPGQDEPKGTIDRVAEAFNVFSLFNFGRLNEKEGDILFSAHLYFRGMCSVLGFEKLSFIPEWADIQNNKENSDIGNSIITNFSKLDFSPDNFSSFEVDEISSHLINKYYTPLLNPQPRLPSTRISKAVAKEITPIQGHITPQYINKLLVSLLDPAQNERICDPCAGLGGTLIEVVNKVFEERDQFGINFNDNANSLDFELEGNEVNTEIFSIIQMRFALLGLPMRTTLHKKDFISISSIENKGIINPIYENLDESKETFLKQYLADVVLCDPPFDLKPQGAFTKDLIVKNEKISLPRNSNDAHFLLSSINKLNPDGRLGIVMSPAFLFREGREKNIRRFLIENDYLESIIQLPKSGYSSIEIRPVILILKTQKNPNRRKKVLFVDVKSFEADVRSNYNLKSIERIVSVYKNFKPRSKNEHIAELEEIQLNDFDLSPNRYLGGLAKEVNQLIKSGVGIKLGDICEFFRGYPKSKQKAKEGIPYITTKDLSDDITFPYLRLKEFSIYKPTPKTRPLDKKCILASLVGRSIKATIFDPAQNIFESDVLEGIISLNQVCIGSNLVSIIPERKIDFEYLYYQLYSPLVKKQLDARSSGLGIPHISLNSLKSIVIPLPNSLLDQKEFVRQQKILLLEAENKRKEYLKARLEIKEEQVKAIRSREEAEFQIIKHLAHNLNPKIGYVRSVLDPLIKIHKDKRISNEILVEQLEEGQNIETVEDAVKKSIKILSQMSDLIRDTRSLIMEKIETKDFKELNLIELFNKEIIPQYEGDAFSIEVFSILNAGKKIQLHRVSFIEAMNNLIRNAKMHAFPHSTSEDKIIFKLNEKGSKIIIDYRNNGLLIPEELNAETFLMFGEKGRNSKGQGLGGAYIGKMVKAHKGEFKILRDTSEGAHFRIELPKGIEDE